MAEKPEGKLRTLAADLCRGEDLFSFIDLLAARFREREQDLHAFVPEVGRFDRLRREAQELFETYPDAERRPPLFGVPVGVKDVFHVHGFLTRAGSRLPPEELHGLEAESVTALKAAGALILGKTVSTEFAYFAPGPTRNPRNPGHTPGGSSSGSAAAVGAGFCPLALGTQTIGSVCRPAAFCGVTGFKPSYDRISRSGLVPLAPSLDHVGTFTGDVAGAELAAGLLCRGWSPRRGASDTSPRRGANGTSPRRGASDTSPDEPEAPRPVLGVPEGLYLERASSEATEHFATVRLRLEKAGYQVKPVPALHDLERIEARHGVIVAAEAARVHSRWFPRFTDLYHPKTAELVRRGADISPESLDAALAGCTELRSALTALMEQHGLDLWITPSAVGAAPAGLEYTGDPVLNLPWTQAGLPALSLPAGRDSEGLPLGLQVIGRWWGDEALLAWGRGIEASITP